jgi:hypothetical protein
MNSILGVLLQEAHRFMSPVNLRMEATYSCETSVLTGATGSKFQRTYKIDTNVKSHKTILSTLHDYIRLFDASYFLIFFAFFLFASTGLFLSSVFAVHTHDCVPLLTHSFSFPCLGLQSFQQFPTLGDAFVVRIREETWH